MKLAASMFCVAALSLAACADVETYGGGQGPGITSSKIADQEFDRLVKQFDPSQVTDNAQKLGGLEPADTVCEGCVMQAYRVVDLNAGIDEVRIVKDGGVQVCKIFLDQGAVIFDECGLSRL
ncbi:MAG TPA: hypothetical protein VFV99_17360 [Kofleriaceae bacterium]|nr:hypothetical protein [Kofleriaceae bacterium]